MDHQDAHDPSPDSPTGPPPASRALTVIGTQYFLYFGVMGVFLPYFNLYCYHLGFSGFQIGTLSAIRSITMVVCSILWSILADRYRARRPIYIACNALSAIIWAGFLLTTNFLPMVLLTLAYGIFYSPLISFLEAFSMDALGPERRGYGQLRVWGSISFILVVVMLGRILDARGTGIIIPLVLAGSLVQAVVSVGISSGEHPQRPSGQRGRLADFFTPQIRVFLCAAFLMLFSHGAYYGFFSIHLETLGFEKSFIGICWALASGAEILVMINSRRLFNRFSMDRVLIFSFVAAAARWALLSTVQGATGIVATQILHAITYGSFHMASILYIDTHTGEEMKTIGQAVNNAVTYGLGLMSGFFVSGWLYEQIGMSWMLWISSAAALVGGVVFWLFAAERARK